MPPYYQKTMPWMTYPCSFKTSWSYHNKVAFYIGHPVVPNCICTLAPTSSNDIFTLGIVLLPKIESVCYLQLSPSSHFTGPDRVQPTASVFFSNPKSQVFSCQAFVSQCILPVVLCRSSVILSGLLKQILNCHSVFLRLFQPVYQSDHRHVTRATRKCLWQIHVKNNLREMIPNCFDSHWINSCYFCKYRCHCTMVIENVWLLFFTNAEMQAYGCKSRTIQYDATKQINKRWIHFDSAIDIRAVMMARNHIYAS